MKINYIYK